MIYPLDAVSKVIFYVNICSSHFLFTGELIYADLNAQTVDGWIWGFAPKAQKKLGKYGFIPRAYTQPYRQNTSV